MTTDVTAIVLGGGGNRGALEVGSLLAFFEYGIRPDILVGSSAGAMNAAFIATDPSAAGAQRLAEIWLQAGEADLFPGNVLTEAVRFLLGKDSLFPNDNLRRFVEANTPPGFRYFGDITETRLLVTAGDLRTGTLFIFGHDPEAPILEAVLASAALPGIYPPIEWDGLQLVDGATVANVPVSIAAEEGATTIYAVSLGYDGHPRAPARGALRVALQSVDVLLFQQFVHDLHDVNRRPGVMVHVIQINAFAGIPRDDFSQVQQMIETGYELTRAYLEHPRAPEEPLVVEWPLPPAAPPPGAQRWPLRP